jgi:hypothetical protein
MTNVFASFDVKDPVSLIATLLAALVGFGGVIWNLRETRKNQEKERAFRAYDAYLKDSFNNPQFANGQLLDKRIKIPEHYGEGSDEFYKYEWFVARLMSAVEQILGAVPRDPEWKDTIKAQIFQHSEYIGTRYFKPDFYSCKLRKIIKEVIESKKLLKEVKGADITNDQGKA